jgi:hypothetical protein
MSCRQVAVTRMLAVHNAVADLYGLHDVAGSEKIRLYTGACLAWWPSFLHTRAAARMSSMSPDALFAGRVQRDD